MALSYGFYNSTNHDRRYDARTISSIFDGIINDGVFGNIGKKFQVTLNKDLTVNVDSGRAWFDHTWTYNDSIVTLTHEAAHQVYDRKDAVVLRVDENKRMNQLLIIKGTPASSPQNPSLTNSDGVHDHVLAYVTIRSQSTAIQSKDINYRVGTSDCPLVTGPLRSITADELTKNWQNAFDELHLEERNEFEALLELLRTQDEQAVSGALQDSSVTFEKLAHNAVRYAFKNQQVLTSAFESDSTYSGYGYSYRGKIALAGVTEDMYPEVSFDVGTLNNYDFAPVAKTYNGGVYVYVSSLPTATITIPTIVCWR